jgi:hypothetical protein
VDISSRRQLRKLVKYIIAGVSHPQFSAFLWLQYRSVRSTELARSIKLLCHMNWLWNIQFDLFHAPCSSISVSRPHHSLHFGSGEALLWGSSPVHCTWLFSSTPGLYPLVALPLWWPKNASVSCQMLSRKQNCPPCYSSTTASDSQWGLKVYMSLFVCMYVYISMCVYILLWSECVLPKFICWNLTTNVMVLRGGLWALGRWFGKDSLSSHVGS